MQLKVYPSNTRSLTSDVDYLFGNEVIPVSLLQLCPDCSSPEIEGMDDYLGYFNVSHITHDQTCPWDDGHE
jgi:hypothetical protein